MKSSKELFNDWIPPAIARRLRKSRLPKVGARPLYQLDTKLARFLPPHGTYIEIGANDGLSQSNTWWLERDRGWSGLLIEPALNRFLELVRNRGSENSFACTACMSPDYLDDHINLIYADLMTTSEVSDLIELEPESHTSRLQDKSVNRVRFSAPVTTLSALIDTFGLPSTIDFLSVDVEGAELHVLGGLDLTRHRVRYLLVETRDQDVVAQWLEQFGYKLLAVLTHHDFLFAPVSDSGDKDQGLSEMSGDHLSS